MAKCKFLEFKRINNRDTVFTADICNKPGVNAAVQGGDVVCIYSITGMQSSCPWAVFEEDNIEKNNDRNVNHPNHYCQGGIECIKAIEASMPPEGFQDYCKGNVLKYIWRWRDKAGVEDLKKARVYLNWLIESAEKGD